MSPDTELVLLFGTLHLIAIGFGVALFVMFLRSESRPEWLYDDGDDDGGSGYELPPAPRAGGPNSGDGLPLPDAVPARVRLREAGRLGDRIERPARRPAREPERRPVRTP